LSEKLSAYCLWPNANTEFELLQLTVRSLKWVRLPLELCIRRDIQWKLPLIYEMERAYAIFWDTLFIGDVGRPDLAQSRFDDARTVSRNIIQFVKNKDNDFAR
jgi:hypothetical protein